MTTAGTTQYCRHCGVAIPPGLAFCGRCGTKVEAAQPAPPLICRSCGAPAAAGTTFCRRCGSPLQGQPAAAAASRPAPPAGYPPSAPGPQPAAYAPPAAPAPQAPAPPAPAYQPTAYRPPPAAGPPAGYAPTGYPPAGYPPAGYPPAPATQPGPYGQPPAGYGPTTWAQAAPTAAAPTGRRGRVPAAIKFGAIAAAIVIIGSIGIKLSQHTPKGCVYTCAPPTGAALPNGNLYSSPFGFSFAYPGGWTKVSVKSPFITGYSRSASLGEFVIEGGNGSPSLASLIQSGGKFVSAEFSQSATVSALPGAEMGDQPGAGELYSAVAQVNGEEIPLRIGVVAAEQGGHWGILIGIGPESNQSMPTGLFGFDGAAYDDVLTQWSWSGS